MRSLVALAFAIALFPAIAVAQLPSPREAEAMLRRNPELARQLRERLKTSGLSAAQIRARLQAEGYPASLLDAYLGAGGAADSLAPSSDVLTAMRRLGIADSTELDSLGARRRRDRIRRTADATWIADSLGISLDSLRQVVDSLPLPLQRRLGVRLADSRSVADSGFTVFGMEIFQRESSEFDPNVGGPVDPGYRLGPGDELVLILTGDVEEAHELSVTREGFVVIPQVGRLNVAGLTLGQLEELLYARLARVYSGVSRSPGATTRFSISVARLRSHQVYVVGDVASPGSYRVSAAGTAMSALYAAGGPTTRGSMRAVEVRRGGRTVGTLDVYDYLLHGNSGNDLRLESGDVVFVPPRGARVRVWGEVIRPATYELRAGETVADLVRAAGGFTEAADRRRVQVERVLPPSERTSAGSDRVVMDIVGATASGTPGADVPLSGGEVVRVFPIAERVSSQVVVEGNVWTPGPVAFRPGMRLSDALRRAGGLQPDSYLGHVLVSRLQPDSTRVQLRATLRDTTGAALDDIALADHDEIRVFSTTELRPARYVVISGSVRNGGRFPYRDGMTLRDAVLLAGGLEEWASLAEAEIARMPENRAGGVTAVTVRVPLDDSFAALAGRPGNGEGDRIAPQATAADAVVLQPYDHVMIPRQTDWMYPRSVVVTGEIRRPGRYTLQAKTERLSDVLSRAGGLTPEAYPDGIVFVRTARGTGRVGVSLSRVLRDPKHPDNLLLMDGDSIAIPMFSAVVQVDGAVNAPSAVPYVPGRSIDYYVAAAGGANERGDASRAFVTQSNGKIQTRRARPFLPDHKPQPGPGARVYVPDAIPANGTSAQTLVLFTQVLSSLAAVIVLARQF